MSAPRVRSSWLPLRPPRPSRWTNDIPKGRVQPPSVLRGTLYFNQEVLWSDLPDSTDRDPQFFGIYAALEICQDRRGADPLRELYQQCLWAGRLGRSSSFISGLVFFFRWSFLAGASTHSSDCLEGFGLFSGFLIEVSWRLIVESLGRFCKSGVDFPLSSRSVWHFSFTRFACLFTLLVFASFPLI